MDNFDEFINDFKESANEHLVIINELLGKISNSTLSRTEIVRAKAVFQREIHTLKGEARMMALQNVGLMCENIEIFFRTATLPLSEQNNEKIKSAVEHLVKLIEMPDETEPYKIDDQNSETVETNIQTQDIETESSISDQSKPSKLNVLLLDDSEIICTLVEQSLTEEGFKVQTALTINEFLQKFETFPAEVLLIDRNLPEVPKETEVIELLRKKCSFEGKILIIFSGDDKETLANLVKKLNADGYILKDDLSKTANALKKIINDVS